HERVLDRVPTRFASRSRRSRAAAGRSGVRWSVVTPPQNASPPSGRILPMLAAWATRRSGFFGVQGYGVMFGAKFGCKFGPTFGPLASDVPRRLAGAAAGVPSQPPAGVLTWVAASGCGSATHVRTAACAAAAVT